MDESPPPVAPERPRKNRATREMPLAWAITILEGGLWLAALWAFTKYWMMLPVPYRAIGVAGLTLSGMIGLFRIIRFYRRSRRKN